MPTTPVRRAPSAPAQGVLLLGFFVAASIGAMWAVLIAMGRATRRVWPVGRTRRAHEHD